MLIIAHLRSSGSRLLIGVQLDSAGNLNTDTK